jgi:hypothetical protein
MSAFTRSHQHHAIMAISTIALTTTSACVAQDHPTTLPDGPYKAPPSLTATTSATPTLAASKLQAPVPGNEAAELTRQGAVNFARYFLEAIDYAYLTGDTSLIAHGSTPTCRPCTVARENIERTYASGGSYVGQETSIDAVESPTIDPVDRAEAFVLYTAPRLDRLDADGRTVGGIPAAYALRSRVDLIWNGESWQVANLVDLED